MSILEKLITLHKITKKDLALQLEISTKTLNKRLKGISEWRIQDIHNIADIFHLTPQQLELIFFSNSKTVNDKQTLEIWGKLLDYFINRNATTKYCNKM